MNGIKRVDSKTLLIILSLNLTCSIPPIVLKWEATGPMKKYHLSSFLEPHQIF